MKNLILGLILLFAICSCQEEGQLTKDPVITTPPIVTPTTEIPPSTQSNYSGVFVSAPGESVSGSAKVELSNIHQLILENLIANGPDLKVYLSKTDKASDFVNLGSLNSAKTIYTIPDNVDIANYSYVIIYCQQYSVIFGVASLKK
jgi:hypothetical protein